MGARLKRLRLEQGLSQRDLSSQGVSYAYISRIEAEARTPSVKALRKLARKLGVSVEYLETGSELREVDDRSMRLAEAELEVRLGGDLPRAERKLEGILDAALEAGDGTAAARARAGLGLLLAARGRHLEAVEHLEQAIGDEHFQPPQLRPDVYGALGQTYVALGAPQRAVSLFEDCLARARRETPRDSDAEIRYSIFLGHALAGTGGTDRAAELLLDALARAREQKDPLGARIQSYWLLGRQSLEQGSPGHAAEYLDDAAALLRARDHQAALARAAQAALEWAESLPEGGDNGRAEAIRARAYDLLVGAEARPIGLS
ncbi:MAG TPA: helix-turn-helix transcriptional regulator [Gaiellaceae bacterium]